MVLVRVLGDGEAAHSRRICVKKTIKFTIGEVMEYKNKKALLEILQLLSLWKIVDEFDFECFGECEEEYCLDVILDIIHKEIHKTLDTLLVDNED